MRSTLTELIIVKFLIPFLTLRNKHFRYYHVFIFLISTRFYDGLAMVLIGSLYSLHVGNMFAKNCP